MRARPWPLAPLTALTALTALTTLALVACGAPQQPPVPEPTQPPTRTTWALRHRVMETTDIRIVGASLSDFEESTTVRLAQGAAPEPIHCYVTLSTPGWGGPENKVGEKVSTRVHDRPGFRNGTGAEGDYLMWQLADGAWFEVGCDGPDERTEIDAVAAAVQLGASSVALPFAVATLPPHHGFSSVTQELDEGLTRATIRPEADGNAELEIAYETGDPDAGYPERTPRGRPVTVNGRPALLDETPRSPGVCVFVQQHHVCVSPVTSDTGPYPDRTDEVPAMLSIAESLTFASDLDDRATWIPAERALG